jgi:hypothetical protein
VVDFPPTEAIIHSMTDITFYHRPYLKSKAGLRVHIGMDGQLWTWKPPDGQHTLANSENAVNWLCRHVRDSPARENAVVLCRSFSVGYRERMRREREAINEERLRMKMNAVATKPKGTHSWNRKVSDSAKGRPE